MNHESAAPLALVIEDNEELSEIFAHAVKEAGFSAAIALDGKQALEQLAQLTPELFILDLHLPHHSGEEILHQIRADERFLKTPIIIATANLRWGRELRNDVTLVLAKPVQYTQLKLFAERLRK